jgi:hypothetical protein
VLSGQARTVHDTESDGLRPGARRRCSLVRRGRSAALGWTVRDLGTGAVSSLHHAGRSAAVTEPSKLLGPPTVVLVQQTSDNPVDVPELLDKFGIFPYLTRNVSPVLQTLQNIGDIRMRK